MELRSGIQPATMKKLQPGLRVGLSLGGKGHVQLIATVKDVKGPWQLLEVFILFMMVIIFF